MKSFSQRWEKVRKPVLSVLIAYVVYAFFLMAWPTNPYFDAKVVFLRPVSRPFYYFSLYNEFKLYAPEPPRQNTAIIFRVRFDDESSNYWVYPRDKLAPWDGEHSFDRYLDMYFFWSKGSLVRKCRPAFARYVARQNDSPSRHPIQVDLIERVRPIPVPEQGIGNLYGPIVQDIEFFSYRVKKEDLL